MRAGYIDFKKFNWTFLISEDPEQPVSKIKEISILENDMIKIAFTETVLAVNSPNLTLSNGNTATFVSQLSDKELTYRIAPADLGALIVGVANGEIANVNRLNVDVVGVIKNKDDNNHPDVSKLSNKRLTITGESVYQPGRGLENLIDDNVTSETELLWDIPSNHVDGALPPAIKLPQIITIKVSNGKPVKLHSLHLTKRTPGNGTLTKYSVKAFKEGAEVYNSGELTVPFDQAEVFYTFDKIIEADALQLIPTEARTSATTVNNKMLTLRELKLYVVTEEEPEVVSDATTGIQVELPAEIAKLVASMGVEDIDEAELGKHSELIRNSDSDLFGFTFRDKAGEKLNINVAVPVTMPIDSGKKVARVIYYNRENHTVKDIEFRQDGNEVFFKAPHFSIYGVIYGTATVTQPNNSTPQQPGAIPPSDNSTPQQPGATPPSANSTPQQPGATPPPANTMPDQTVVPTQPTPPSQVQDSDTSKSTEKSQVANKSTETVAQPKPSGQANTLPATGEDNTYAIFGVAALSILSGLGMIVTHKKEQD